MTSTYSNGVWTHYLLITIRYGARVPLIFLYLLQFRLANNIQSMRKMFSRVLCIEFFLSVETTGHKIDVKQSIWFIFLFFFYICYFLYENMIWVLNRTLQLSTCSLKQKKNYIKWSIRTLELARNDFLLICTKCRRIV